MTMAKYVGLMEPWRVGLNRQLCDANLIGTHITARVCYDRRRVYRGVIEGPSDNEFAIDNVPQALYTLRVTNKPTRSRPVHVFQEDGQWLVLQHRPEE